MRSRRGMRVAAVTSALRAAGALKLRPYAWRNLGAPASRSGKWRRRGRKLCLAEPEGPFGRVRGPGGAHASHGRNSASRDLGSGRDCAAARACALGPPRQVPRGRGRDGGKAPGRAFAGERGRGCRCLTHRARRPGTGIWVTGVPAPFAVTRLLADAERSEGRRKGRDSATRIFHVGRFGRPN